MKITSPRLAFEFFSEKIKSDVEEFWIAALNSEKRVLKAACLFRGTVDSCPFYPRDVFRFGCLQNASSVIVAHNHPTGQPLPSVYDRRVTRQLVAASYILEVALEDHIILATGGYFSFLNSGDLDDMGAKALAWLDDP